MEIMVFLCQFSSEVGNVIIAAIAGKIIKTSSVAI
jgi:hypothetical protein